MSVAPRRKRTPIFPLKLLLALLAINKAVCTTDRSGKVIKRSLGTPSVEMPASYFDKAALRSKIVVSGVIGLPAGEIVRAGLRSYRVQHAVSVERTGYFADRFPDEHYVSGPPKDYVSDVVLYEEGREVRRSEVRVNSPLVYNGARLHQSFFGTAVEMTLRDPAGTLVARKRVPRAWRVGECPFGSFVVPSQGLKVYVIGHASAFIDGAIPAGQVKVEVYKLADDSPHAPGNVTQGGEAELAGLNYEFVREIQFSGFKVVRNPASTLLWGASIAFVIGLIWVLYFKPKQLWAQARRLSDETFEISFGAARGKRNHFVDQFTGITHRSATRARSLGSVQDLEYKGNS